MDCMVFLNSIEKACGKIGLVIVNSVIVLGGFVLVLIAVLYLNKLHAFENFMKLPHTDFLCVVEGIFVIAISGLAYFVFLMTRNNYLILKSFGVCLVLAIIVELTIFAFIIKSLKGINDPERRADINMEIVENPEHLKYWFDGERRLKCCGYMVTKIDYGLNFPASCCGEERDFEDIFDYSCTPEEAYKELCYYKSLSLTDNMRTTIRSITVAIVLLQIWQIITVVIRIWRKE